MERDIDRLLQNALRRRALVEDPKDTEILRLRAQLESARDAALEEADARMREIAQRHESVPIIVAELIFAVRAMKGKS